jgi:SAM-dependent methyltransferase
VLEASVLADLARSARTAALRLASPLDRLWRAASGRPRLPPLWLRRHTGPVSEFESAARETSALLDRLGLLEDVRLVLDVGCGAGAMVEDFRRHLPPDGRYVGFDVHAPSIRWCRRRWASDPRLVFEIADVSSPYGSARGGRVESYRFPVGDGEADLVLAKSVFTHLQAAEAAHYLSEIRRALRPGRPAVVTAFLYAKDDRAAKAAFPYEVGEGVRVRSSARPTAAVAFEKTGFVSLLEEAGLHLQWHSEGYYPGREALTAQDVLLLGH